MTKTNKSKSVKEIFFLHTLIHDVPVKVDCLTAHYYDLVPKKLHKYWVNKTESYKDSDTWLNEPKGVDDMYHEGRRYHDNKRVVDVILGCMRQQIQQQLFGNIHSEIDESILAKSFKYAWSEFFLVIAFACS